MTRRVQLLDIRKIKNTLITAAKTYVTKEFIPEVVVPEVQRVVREAHARTTKGWMGGAGAPVVSDKTHTEAKTPEVKFDVTETRFGVEIVAWVDSYIWNLLDQGRDDRVTKGYEVFVPRAKQRTIPGSLDVSTDRSYLDKVVIPPGTQVKGFEGRGWSKLIADEVERELGVKYPNLKFTFTVKEQPIG